MMIGEYYFLFGLALVWMIFATVQDLRKREVADWLNFSLIAFALAYRAFYSAALSDWNFFLYGLMGFGIFFVLANVFYYSKLFAGGDAKLLMALGAILPFAAWVDFVYFGFGFIVLLFMMGAVYSLIYSVCIAIKNGKKFAGEFGKGWKGLVARKNMIVIVFVFVLLCYLIMGKWMLICAGVAAFILILYVYLMAVDKCMIKLVSAKDLQEGDWIEKEIKLKGEVIGKSVHGLSAEQIKKLRKLNKKILVKEGIPFVPAFLISWIIFIAFMVLFF